ncbi:glycosyltransferase family 39 protein [Moniliophthora roreri MCA 2997]|uniref:Glycosyltransferase family 39 protein n=2 Tax=Moniliophthora roreri TaxID=221103 RepID=V2X8L9_MONRO|nr:glycosyltransferase family 39 protein [Moniliophthora roreri MCA 2997]KAI3607434.1 glycosyltransferase family 39 protein [Moniliophthora roreri]
MSSKPSTLVSLKGQENSLEITVEKERVENEASGDPKTSRLKGLLSLLIFVSLLALVTMRSCFLHGWEKIEEKDIREYTRIAIGSRVILHSLRNSGTLHSTNSHSYPNGSRQQIVSLSEEQESTWQFRNATSDYDSDVETDWTVPPLVYITNGMRIRLRHPSYKNLHSHDIRPPVSTNGMLNEVSAYGLEGFHGDANDDWVVETLKDNSEYLWTHMPFRLRHAITGCYLATGEGIKLPEWGFNETAVYCDRTVPSKEALGLNVVWVVFNSTHPHVLPEKFTEGRSGSVKFESGGFISNFFKSFNLFE